MHIPEPNDLTGRNGDQSDEPLIHTHNKEQNLEEGDIEIRLELNQPIPKHKEAEFPIMDQTPYKINRD